MISIEIDYRFKMSIVLSCPDCGRKTKRPFLSRTSTLKCPCGWSDDSLLDLRSFREVQEYLDSHLPDE